MGLVAKQAVLRLPVDKNVRKNNVKLVAGLEFQKDIHEIQSKLPLYYKFKIISETLFAAAILMAIFPVLTLVAIVIRWRMGGPVLYRQLRVGVNGKLFMAYKFRTMRNDSPKVVEMGFRPREKVVEDPRVEGRLGRFLRKWKWDELPQLWNVVKGDMVLIGPRPYLYEENLDVDPRNIARFAVRPGISGLWQARNSKINNPHLKARLDCYYVRKISLSTDFWIWMRTFYIVSIGEKF